MENAEELEGLEKLRAWVKSIYIFGLFEGQTGQEAPWYLKPVRRRVACGSDRCSLATGSMGREDREYTLPGEKGVSRGER